MKPYRLYIALLVLMLLGYVVYVASQPPKVNWNKTYQIRDTNPFGASILAERSGDIFPAFSSSNETISQYSREDNLLLLADRLEVSKVDYDGLMMLLNAGRHVLLGANDFGDLLPDSLGFQTDYKFNLLDIGLMEDEESELKIGKKSYQYPSNLIKGSYFIESDSTWEILATTFYGPIAMRRQVGEGTLILVVNPLIFTNFGMLYNRNNGAAAQLLSELPYEPVHYSMFYQFGKTADTPLRYFLSQPPLKWAIYLALFSIVVLIFIDSWRRQRRIPVVLPPENTSVLYAQTLGGLYYREGNHFQTALKLISHFYAEIRERYWLEPEYSDKFYGQLAGKSGMEKSHVVVTFQLIEKARKNPILTEIQLVELAKKIDTFK